MLIADNHVHSIFSVDAEEAVKDMCQTAIDKGLSFICFTDHLDMNPADEGYNYFDSDAYLQAIEDARSEFKEEIIILSGVEFSEPNLYPDRFEKVLSRGYDTVLGAVHMIDDKFVDDDELINTHAPEEIYKKYFNLVLKMVECGGFNILAHLDFPKRYLRVNYEINEIIRQILKTIIKKDIALEINTSSLRKGLNESMPGSEIIALYAELGGKKVTLGSDAHRSCDIASNFDYALKIIDKYGFDNGYYKEGKFEYLWF